MSVPASSGRVLCLGEALVDLICERWIGHVAQADSFVPHLGGTAANIAALIARCGTRVALAGAAGNDAWGEWARRRLTEEGVDVAAFRLLDGRSTGLALVTIDRAGEASYAIYGEPDGSLAAGLEDVEPQAARSRGALDGLLENCSALLLGTNTLVDEADREVTMRARELALEGGKPILFDPNIRLHRWRSRTEVAAVANACVPGAMLVRANAAEAALMTREEDLERAAQSLLKAGARNVVISSGAGGASLRGCFRLDVPGVPAGERLRSTIGAGDAMTATLVSRLAAAGWYEPALAAGLRDAVIASAEACRRWGASD